MMPPSEETGAVLAVQMANLDSKLDAIHTSLKEDIREVKDDVGRVEKQAETTNGRVTKHDEKLAELRGAGVAFGLASPFLVALLAFFLVKFFGG